MNANTRESQAVPLVAPLTHFGRGDLSVAGGKGANLGELLNAGFDVPPGFVVTTAAYDLLLQTAGLTESLHAENRRASEDGDDAPDPGRDLSAQMHEAIQAATMPDALKAQIVDAWHHLGAGAVAVRSSATAEDLPGAAFAGQQETFLNVQGEPELLEAVRGCWASLWSERAVAYRARQHMDQDNVKLAVVVQQMVEADAAGVMFTADPVSGAREELVIDANPGLGEAVVAGMVTPDHIVVDKRSKRVKEQRLGRREIVVRAKAGGGTEQIKSDSAVPTSPVLPVPAIQRLSQLGLQIEHHYRVPQDIEWAWIQDGTQAGKMLILQARPMTALPKPLKVSGPMRMIVPMLAEMWPVRPYPLDMTTFTGAVERAIGSFLQVLIGPSAPDPDKALIEEDGVVVRFEPPQLRPKPSMLIMPWLALWRARHYEPARWQADPSLAEFIAEAHELEERQLQSFTWKQNINTVQEALACVPRAMVLREHYLPRALVGLVGLWLLLALVGRRDRFGELTSGIETKTVETNQALESLARQIRADPSPRELFAQHDAHELKAALEASNHGRDFLKSFEAFLNEYGHRETTLTISQPAWKDEPEVVMGILKVLAGIEPKSVRAPSPPASRAGGERSQAEAWQRARDDLLARSPLGKWPLRDAFLGTLRNARALFQIREDTHFYVTMLQPTIRHVALELGQRLKEAGALAETSDIFHLRLEELESVEEPRALSEERVRQLRELVNRRRAKRESLASIPMVDPRLLAVERGTPAGDDVLLRGSSGSPGTATGPARIVHDSSEFGKLQAGEVLVAPVTNPAWTPLFQRAIAVVVDTGGAASHAAIVAREYGIPAVMGTMNGTTQLKDGQQIEVDGTRGLVMRVKELE